MAVYRAHNLICRKYLTFNLAEWSKKRVPLRQTRAPSARDPTRRKSEQERPTASSD